MEHASSKNQETVFHDYEVLRMADYCTPSITVIEQTSHKHYQFRKYQLFGNWGICNGEKTQKIVKEKPNYQTVDILIYAQLLVAGNPKAGWDVYSLEGKFLKHLPPMTLDEATNYLNEKKRNSQ